MLTRKLFVLKVVFFTLTFFASESVMVQRVSKFMTFNKTLNQTSDFISGNSALQLSLQSKPYCALICLKTEFCLSVLFQSIYCSLFKTDPPLSFNFTIGTNSTSKTAFYGMSQDKDKLNCIVNQSEASRDQKDSICELSQKTIDSKCEEFSDWKFNYLYPCENTKLIANKTRQKVCSDALNGGKTCDRTPIQVMELVPVFINFHSELTLYHSWSKRICENDKSSELFSNIALLSGLVPTPHVLSRDLIYRINTPRI